MADMVRPPANPISVIASETAAATAGVNGVIHQSAVPMAVALRTPPTNPSQVLFGLTTGAILCRPAFSPTHTAARHSTGPPGTASVSRDAHSPGSATSAAP